MTGWVKLHRSIQSHWIWDDPVKLKWWLDLILMANHQSNKILINGELVNIGVGERHTSEEKLASRWNVSRNTVRKFMKLLEKDDMISVKKSRQKGTTYKVLQYNAYQGLSEDKKQRTEQRSEQQKDNALHINKNDKNEKNEKNINTPNQDSLVSDFEKLWKLYPNKKGKAAALKSYKRSIKKGTTNKQIQNGIIAYKKSIAEKGIEQAYQKHGSTFFSGESWEDDYSSDTVSDTTGKASTIPYLDEKGVYE